MSSNAASAPPKRKSHPTFHFTAGLASGTLSAVLLQPIDLLKTRVQQSGHHSLRTALRDIRATPGGTIPALWRGAVPSALRTGFGSAIYFTSLNTIRDYAARKRVPFLAAAAAVPTAALTSTEGVGNGSVGGATNGNNSSKFSSTSSVHSLNGTASNSSNNSSSSISSSTLPKLSNTGNLVAGASARTFAGMILMPLTIIKVRYESSLYNYTSMAAASRDILRVEGLRGFFSGFGATAMRDAPYAGLYVLFYEQSKKRLGELVLARSKTQSDMGGGRGGGMSTSSAATVNFTSGTLAGAACSAISNPFDAVKTRIQLQPGVYRNMWHAARRMIGEEGWRSMLDGLALRMGRKAMSSALAWTVYEELIRRAERRLDV